MIAVADYYSLQALTLRQLFIASPFTNHFLTRDKRYDSTIYSVLVEYRHVKMIIDTILCKIRLIALCVLSNGNAIFQHFLAVKKKIEE